MEDLEQEDSKYKANYKVFRECLSTAVVEKSFEDHRVQKKNGRGTRSTRRRAQKYSPRRNKREDNDILGVNSDGGIEEERADPEELAEFVDVSINRITKPIIAIMFYNNRSTYH